MAALAGADALDQGTHRLVLDVPGSNLALDLFVLSQHLGTMLDAAFRGTGVTPSQYAVYSQLARTAQTPGQLSEALGLRAATLSGHLATMAGRGHLTRSRNAADGRSALVSLTARGRATCHTCRQRMRGALTTLNGQVGGPEDVAAMRALLGRLDEAVVAAGAKLEARQR